MHTAQDGESAGSLSYETGALVRIDLTTYNHSMSDLPGNIAHLREHYHGPLTVASDLLCVTIE